MSKDSPPRSLDPWPISAKDFHRRFRSQGGRYGDSNDSPPRSLNLLWPISGKGLPQGGSGVQGGRYGDVERFTSAISDLPVAYFGQRTSTGRFRSSRRTLRGCRTIHLRESLESPCGLFRAKDFHREVQEFKEDATGMSNDSPPRSLDLPVAYFGQRTSTGVQEFKEDATGMSNDSPPRSLISLWPISGKRLPQGGSGVQGGRYGAKNSPPDLLSSL